MSHQVSILLNDELGAISLLDIDKNKIIKKRIKYDSNIIMPGLLGPDMPKYLSKQGEKLQYYYPELIEL